MKKTILFTVILAFFTFSQSYSQNRSINFTDKPFADLLAMAKKENKMVFMDAFAVWCGPCKWMSANIFTNDTVADFYNKNFICAKFDMEKGEGIKIRERYEVRAYPTLLFIRPDGSLAHLKVGAAQAVADYIALAQRAMNPDECFAAYVKRYNEGESSPAFMFSYLKVLSDAYLPVDVPLNKYFSTQKEKDLISNSNFRLIYSYCNDMDSREFRYLVSHQQEFAKVHGKDSVETKLYNVFVKALVDLSRSEMMGDSTYAHLKRDITATGYSGTGKVFFDADLNLYQSQGDASRFMALMVKDLDKYYNNDPTMLNNVAWMVHENSKDRKYLEKAMQWAKRSVELKPEASNNDTYGALLYDLGKKEEAIKFCRIALELAKKDNLPSGGIEDNLKKYESGK